MNSLRSGLFRSAIDPLAGPVLIPTTGGSAMTTRKSQATATQVHEIPAQEQRSDNGSLNRVALVGRLVADPTPRTRCLVSRVTTVRIAANERGSAVFHDVVLWRQLADS
jgi:hypothetical protein